MTRHLRLLAVSALALAGVLTAGSSAPATPLGPPGGRIYAHDHLYRTIGTPTDLPPVGKFDTIYALGGTLFNVAEVAPGDRDFNGGRWEVRPIVWTGTSPTQFTNAEQILAAVAAGQIQIGDVIQRFECPLIRVQGER
jgi:hypothetical protein